KLREIAARLGKKLAKFAKRIGKKLFGKRKKPKKLTAKPARRAKPDKRAQAEKRVSAATDFIGRQLDRGMWEPVLWAQMQYARLRWRVRLSFRARDDTGTVTISGSPAKNIKTKRKRRPPYSPGIAAYQGFLRAYHHRHH